MLDLNAYTQQDAPLPGQGFEGLETEKQDKNSLPHGCSPINEILPLLKGAKRSGNGWVALCPAHDDRTASLSITEGTDGRVLLKCHAGCSVEKITEALGLTTADLFPTKTEGRGVPKTEAGRRVHLYADAEGLPLYRKTIRSYSDRTKNAFFERYEAGQWIKGLGGIKQTLYNLPGLNTPGPVFLSESEKDADSVIELGLVASAFGGAENWKAQHAEILAEREVIILEHNDEPGRKAAEKAARDLAARSCNVKIIPGETWGTAKGADVSDWIEAGHTAEELENKAKGIQHTPRILTPFKAVNLYTLLTLELPERGYIIGPVIPEQGLVMIYGPRGCGKTWVVDTLAYAAACGTIAFAHWKADRPRRTIIIDGEMPAISNQHRFASIIAGFEAEPPDSSYIKIITPDLQERNMPNLSTEEGQEAIQPFIDEAEFVIVDNLASLARHGRENDSESWLPVQTWLLGLRRQGKAVILVHHAGKNGNQRGTSSKEDVLDTVISLRRPADYTPGEGARFEVHLEKARGVYGPEAMPFELTLRTDNGAVKWISRTIEDAEKDRAFELKADGLTVREIAAEMGISKSKVQRMLKEAGE